MVEVIEVVEVVVEIVVVVAVLIILSSYIFLFIPFYGVAIPAEFGALA